MRQRTDKVLLACALTGFLVLSISFLLMGSDQFGILPGILFWAGLMLGFLFLWILERRRRFFFRRFRIDRKRMQKPRPGVLNFGSGVLATIFDWILLISLVTTGILWYATHGIGGENYIFLSITVFSFSMHCVLNGRIFFHVMNQQKIQHMLEKNLKKTKREEGTI